MPFDITTRVNEMLRAIYMQEGDIAVFAHRALWRRLFKREIWAVGIKKREELVVRLMNGAPVRRFGDMEIVSDSDLWPDDVCAAVAALRLTQ